MNIHSAIIKGPKKEKLQDALGIINQKYYSLFIVADGLGSSKNSDYGAKKAIVSVEKAVNQWRKLDKKDNKVLILCTTITPHQSCTVWHHIIISVPYCIAIFIKQ